MKLRNEEKQELPPGCIPQEEAQRLVDETVEKVKAAIASTAAAFNANKELRDAFDRIDEELMHRDKKMNYRVMSIIETLIGCLWHLSGILAWSSDRQVALLEVLIGTLWVILGEIRMQRRY